MANFWLINPVKVSGANLLPGTSVAATSAPTVTAAGGLLWPQGNAIVDAAALVAQNAHRNRGANEQELLQIMQAAVDGAQSALDAAQDAQLEASKPVIFTYREGEPAPAGSIHASFDAAYVAHIATGRWGEMHVDNTLGAPTTSGSAYDFTKLVLKGLPLDPTGAPVALTFANGATVSGWYRTDALKCISTSAAPITAYSTPATAKKVLQTNGAFFVASGTAPFFAVTGGASMLQFAEKNSGNLLDAQPVISATAPSTWYGFFGEGCSNEAAALAGSGDFYANVQSTAVLNVSDVQPGVTGSFLKVLLARADNMATLDAGGLFTAGDVDGALAEVKLRRVLLSIPFGSLVALGAVLTGSINIGGLLPDNAVLAGAEESVTTLFQNAGDTATLTSSVGTSAAGAVDALVKDADMHTTGKKGAGGTNLMRSAAGEQPRVTFTSNVNLDTFTAGAATVTLYYRLMP